jgi:ABC-type uncharacterized transport system permease subunit
MLIDPVTLVVALIIASTPVLLAAIGELVVEKTGVLNLGVEGMMIIGAVTGFVVAVETGSVTLAFLAGMGGGMALAAVFAVLTQILLSNQVATGLALTLFGIGLAALLGVGYPGSTLPPVPDVFPQSMQAIPVAGPILFSHSAMIYLAIILVAAVWYVLAHTRTGLILRAVGESHDAAHALGYKVIRIRIAAILFGGACAGLGGAFLSVARVQNWIEGMTAGAGWIALALVVFASCRTTRSPSASSMSARSATAAGPTSTTRAGSPSRSISATPSRRSTRKACPKAPTPNARSPRWCCRAPTDLHHLLRLHGRDVAVAEKFPDVKFEHATGYKRPTTSRRPTPPASTRAAR